MEDAPRTVEDSKDMIEYVRFNKVTGRNDTKKFLRSEDRQRRAEGWQPLRETDVTEKTGDDR